MVKVNKNVQNILSNNLRLDKGIVDGYILFCNKHLKKDVLQNKYITLQKFFNKIDSTGISEPYNEDKAYFEKENKCYKLTIRLHGENKTILSFIK